MRAEPGPSSGPPLPRGPPKAILGSADPASGRWHRRDRRGGQGGRPIFERMLRLGVKPERIVVGVISGTSADSITVAVCRINGGGVPTAGTPGALVRLLHLHEHPYDPSVRRQVLGAAELKVRAVAEL